MTGDNGKITVLMEKEEAVAYTRAAIRQSTGLRIVAPRFLRSR